MAELRSKPKPFGYQNPFSQILQSWQDWDEGKELVSGTKSKRHQRETNNIIMEHFKKLKINAKISPMNKISNL